MAQGRMTEHDAEVSGWVVIIVMILAIFAVLFAIFKPPVFSAEVVESKAITGSFIVSGYADGQFAIKGEPEKTLNEGIAKVKSQIKFLSEDLQLQFVAIGSADATGIGNDELAGKRSDQVKAVLFADFPEAKIVSWSRGDADNIKQVRVDYKITLKPAPIAMASSRPEKPAKKFDTFDWLAIIGFGVVVILGVSLFLFKAQADREARKKLLTQKPLTQKSGAEERWLDVETTDEKKISFLVTYDYVRGEIISPYKSVSGLEIKEPIVRPKRMEGSLRRCFYNKAFSYQTEKLVAEGVIKEKI